MTSRSRRRRTSLCAALLVLTAGAQTRADDEVAPPILPPREPRLELAAFPIVSGNRDIGFQFGGAAFLSRIAENRKPYYWRGETGLTASVRSTDGNTEIAQQIYGVKFDYPRAFDSTVRLMPAASYDHYVNAGYYGIGNASTATLANDGSGRRYQSILDEIQARCEVRMPVGGPFDMMMGGQARRTNADVYPGSKLQSDTLVLAPGGEPRVFGVGPMGAVIPGAGLVYDTRDNEISPRSGGFDILGLRAGIGLTDSQTRYVAASLMLRHYFPLIGPLVLATRFMGDAIMGDAPFFDQIKGMTFTPVTMFGGGRGVRGVPDGRYAGKIKMLASAELRSLITDFRFLQQRFRVGAQTFVDAGRVFSDFTPDPALDGDTLGLKYGVGAGTYVIWGEAAVIRMELAYSPDAAVYGGSFPLAFYIVDSHAF